MKCLVVKWKIRLWAQANTWLLNTMQSLDSGLLIALCSLLQLRDWDDLYPSFRWLLFKMKNGKYSSLLLLFAAIELSNVVRATVWRKEKSIFHDPILDTRSNCHCDATEMKYWKVLCNIIKLTPPSGTSMFAKYISKQFLWHKLIINGFHVYEILTPARMKPNNKWLQSIFDRKFLLRVIFQSPIPIGEQIEATNHTNEKTTFTSVSQIRY